MIDFQCAITDLKRCSGITAAHRGIPGRYDLIVESPDCGVARCCLALALSFVSAATDGSFPGTTERDILQAARTALHGQHQRPLRPPRFQLLIGHRTPPHASTAWHGPCSV